MTNWNPEQEPYRVCWIHQSNRSGMHGWDSRCETFASIEAAVEAAKRPFPAGVRRAMVDMAVNTGTWSRDGRWKQVGRRNRRHEFQPGKHIIECLTDAGDAPVYAVLAEAEPPCPSCGGTGTSHGGRSDLPRGHDDTRCAACGGTGEAPKVPDGMRRPLGFYIA